MNTDKSPRSGAESLQIIVPKKNYWEIVDEHVEMLTKKVNVLDSTFKEITDLARVTKEAITKTQLDHVRLNELNTRLMHVEAIVLHMVNGEESDDEEYSPKRSQFIDDMAEDSDDEEPAPKRRRLTKKPINKA